MSRADDALRSVRVANVLAAGFLRLNHGASRAVILMSYAACSGARTVPKSKKGCTWLHWPSLAAPEEFGARALQMRPPSRGVPLRGRRAS
jgi:hypothetical protein